MLNLKLGATPETATEYPLPTSLSELPLSTYLKLPSTKDAAEMLHVLCGAPLDVLRKLPAAAAEEILMHVNQLLQAAPPPGTEAVQEFILKDITWHVPQDIGACEFGQWIDSEAFMEKHKGNEAAFYPWMLAIYCFPEGGVSGDYTAPELEQRAQAFLALDTLTAQKINAFFLTCGERYLNAFARYFPSPILATFKQARRSLRDAGALSLPSASSPASMNFLKASSE